ncbi:aldo/keto reductase [Ramlibacter sp. AN1015]|uniref:aldo/keto reductase n=1 Tax=Ramlibacter sp. AN1015 TaxID=3133428 RepID=UPI0030C1D977
MQRRSFVAAATAGAGLALVPAPGWAQAPASALPTRAIPSTGERLPLVGLGTWITFNVGRDPQGRRQSTEVMRAFFDGGGRLIDSSPMYGSAQEVVGEGLRQLGSPAAVFSADKVWTSGDGAVQVERSRQLWGVARFDLLQVHNLLAWERQLPLLLEMRAAGRLRHVGITTSEGRRHELFEKLMRTQPLDFVQLSYNILDTEAEQRLLPLAAERGIAVLANRPFRQGDLLRQLQRHPLPGWAAEIGCTSWAQVALKYIVSHPVVTCAIPATTQVAHVRENLAAGTGPLPDAALRRRMAAELRAL